MKNTIVITGLLGLAASILVGCGEYLLHYDTLARFNADNAPFAFMQGIKPMRSTIGHFFGVFGATLYPIGCFHIYLMLRPANKKAAFSAFLIGSFGFIVGAVWIGSRASVSALANLPPTHDISNLIQLYELRYENLLTVVRITTLLLSIIYIWLTLTGRSHYKRWMAFFNPLLMIIGSFVIYQVAPSIGKHLMPIALNVAFFIFFILSLFQAKTVNH